MERVKTGRGGGKLLLSGYAYIVDKKIKETTYCRCEKREECSATLKTIDDKIQSSACDHSHPPDGARNSVLKVMDGMKSKAEHSGEVTSSLQFLVK